MPDYGDRKGFQGSGKGQAATGGMGKGQGSGYGGGGAKGGEQRGKSFDSGYTPTQTNYLGTQTFADEGGPAFAETRQKAAQDRLETVVAQNPSVFSKVNNPTVRIDAFGNEQVYDSKTGAYVGSMGRVGDFMRVPGIASFALRFANVNPDAPTFNVSPAFAKFGGLDGMRGRVDSLEREMGGGNGPADDLEIMEILYPSKETPMEEQSIQAQPIQAQPVIPGYNLAFKDFYGQQLPMRNGGLASLPMNFNPMTNANPFSMMMRGGQM